MGNVLGAAGRDQANLQERLATAKVTGRLRLVVSDPIEDVLESPELVNLKALDLSHCNLTRLPRGVGTTVRKIQVLKLSDNPQLESLPTELAALKDLRRLDCTNCVKLSSLEVLPKGVEILELSGCNFGGIIQHPTLPLSAQLSKLDLSRNKGITALGPAFGFEIMENLTELDLSFTSISEIPSEIGFLKNLSVLKLEGTLVESLPTELFEKTLVSRLELKGSKFTKDSFLNLPGIETFLKRRKERLDRDINGGVISTDRSICGLD